jgi:hypothetical protein
MESSITKEQIELFKFVMEQAEPYTEEEFSQKYRYDETDENVSKRIDATMAKKILIEHGIIK